MTAASPPEGVYRVLLADDFPDLRALVRTVLERSGRFTVIAEVGNGRDVVTAAKEHAPDITLLDLSMPFMDGLDALPMIREAAPDCRIIVLSGFEQEPTARRALDEGAAGYITKGVTPDRLVSEVLAIVEG